MRSRYLVDTGRWHDEVAGWKVDMGGALMPELNDVFATGFAAAQRGDLPTARKALATMLELLPQSPAAFDSAGTPPDDPVRRLPQIQKLQLQAAILSAEGHGDQAVAMVQRAVAIGKNCRTRSAPQVLRSPRTSFLVSSC